MPRHSRFYIYPSLESFLVDDRHSVNIDRTALVPHYNDTILSFFNLRMLLINRHSERSGDPESSAFNSTGNWSPAFAGMTTKELIRVPLRIDKGK